MVVIAADAVAVAVAGAGGGAGGGDGLSSGQPSTASGSVARRQQESQRVLETGRRDRMKILRGRVVSAHARPASPSGPARSADECSIHATIHGPGDRELAEESSLSRSASVGRCRARAGPVPGTYRRAAVGDPRRTRRLAARVRRPRGLRPERAQGRELAQAGVPLGARLGGLLRVIAERAVVHRIRAITGDEVAAAIAWGREIEDAGILEVVVLWHRVLVAVDRVGVRR